VRHFDDDCILVVEYKSANLFEQEAPKRQFGNVWAEANNGQCLLCMPTARDFSVFDGVRVARELDAFVRVYGKPAGIVSDNGTEFTSQAILKWANENDAEWQ
jgi:hypothetical protein